jgi:outer membrane protein assembly factor BamE (lipoprotein component of BamABCDE complex)
MIKILYLILLSLIVANCSFNKVLKKHGVRNLEKKHEKLIVGKSNTNDLKRLLGPPSTKSTFDNDIWIYIEREITSQPLVKLGKAKLITNNVLIVEINNKGLIFNKEFYDIEKMNTLNFSEMETDANYSKKSFVYDFLSSMRQKINDPLGKRKKP